MESPAIRVAFVVCGLLGLFTESRGGGFHYIGAKCLQFVKRWQIRIVSLILVGFLVSIFLPVWNVGYNSAHATSSLSSLRQLGLALSRYTEAHDGHLPDRVGSEKMFLQLSPYFVSGIHDAPARPQEFPLRICRASGKPFVWRRSLSGLKVANVKNRDKIIVAYSQTYRNMGQHRSVLFLDGHVKQYGFPDDFWKVWRDQPSLKSLTTQGKTEPHPVH